MEKWENLLYYVVIWVNQTLKHLTNTWGIFDNVKFQSCKTSPNADHDEIKSHRDI